MTSRNLYLVQVVDYYGPNKFLPLAASYHWLYANQDRRVQEQWDIKGVLIEKLPIDQWVTLMESPGMVLMSSYIWNWEYNRALAMRIKSQWPLCKIITGGPQISKHSLDQIRHNTCFDAFVLGENENATREMLANPDPRFWATLPGVITPGSTEISQPPRTQCLDLLPSPILTGFYDWIMDSYKTVSHDTIMWQITFETMRGCPYHCAFCDIGDDYWNKIQWFALDRIRQEIEWMADRKIEYVSVCDSNWGISERDELITQWVIDCKSRTGFPRVWDVTWAKNNANRVKKIASMDSRAKTRLFKGITFALQSLDLKTLLNTRRFNLTDSNVHSSMQFMRSNNIPTYSEMIWPLPGETLSSFESGLQKLIDMGQKDFVMVHPLVLTPNSEMGQPDYIQAHDLQTVSVPLDTFWLKIDDTDSYIQEKVDAVISTSSVDFDTMIEGNMLAHWLIVFYYYGWAHAVIEFISKSQELTQLDVIKRFLSWMHGNPGSLLANEDQITRASLRDVFQAGKFWGRRLDNNVLWEYKSATSVIFHKNRELVASDITSMIHDQFGIASRDLVRLNMDQCYDWRKSYPFVGDYDSYVIKKCLDIDSHKLIIDHWDHGMILDEETFIHKAYHWQRKNRYWKCDCKAYS